jgi:hypothetical protein
LSTFYLSLVLYFISILEFISDATMGVGSSRALTRDVLIFVIMLLTVISESSIFIKFYCRDIKNSSKEEGTLAWIHRHMN